MKVRQEMILAVITTLLKLLQRFLAVRVGKMIRLEMRSAPSRRMPRTIMSEQMMAKMPS